MKVVYHTIRIRDAFQAHRQGGSRGFADCGRSRSPKWVTTTTKLKATTENRVITKKVTQK